MVPLFSRRRGTPLHYSLKLIRENDNRCTVMRCNSKINCSKQFFRHVLGTSPPLTEVSRALRARAERVSRKCLPGPPAPGPQKVSKKSRGQSGRSPESLRKVSGECFWSVPWTFWRLFGVPGPKKSGPGDIFETLSAFRALWRARETSVRGGLVPKAVTPVCSQYFG